MKDQEKTTKGIWLNNAITKKEEKSPDIFSDSNKVLVRGTITSEFVYRDEVKGEKFYQSKVSTIRKSGIEDLIPVVVSEVLLERNGLTDSAEGKWIEVVGEFKSRNKIGDDGCNHVILFLFATEINTDDSEDEMKQDANCIYLDGYFCKPPIYRRTPLGREITDMLIAVNSPSGEAAYLPCIAWGRNAQWVCKFDVGDRIELYGRIQSREYIKRATSDSSDGVRKVAYEISIIVMRKLDK